MISMKNVNVLYNIQSKPSRNLIHKRNEVDHHMSQIKHRFGNKNKLCGENIFSSGQFKLIVFLYLNDKRRSQRHYIFEKTS